MHDLFERNLPFVKEAKGEGEGEEGEEKGEQHEEYSWYDKELTIETTTSEGKEIKEYWWGVARNERSGRRIGTEEDFGKFKKQLNEILKLPVEIGDQRLLMERKEGKVMTEETMEEVAAVAAMTMRTTVTATLARTATPFQQQSEMACRSGTGSLAA